MKERANQIQNVLNERKGQINDKTTEILYHDCQQIYPNQFYPNFRLEEIQISYCIKMDSLPRDLVNVIEDYAKETTNFDLMIADLSDWFALAQRPQRCEWAFSKLLLKRTRQYHT